MSQPLKSRGLRRVRFRIGPLSETVSTHLRVVVRRGRVQDVEDGLSHMPHVILNQARVHDFYLDVMRKSPTKLEPYYARRCPDLESAKYHANAMKQENVPGGCRERTEWRWQTNE